MEFKNFYDEKIKAITKVGAEWAKEIKGDISFREIAKDLPITDGALSNCFNYHVGVTHRDIHKVRREKAVAIFEKFKKLGSQDGSVSDLEHAEFFEKFLELSREASNFGVKLKLESA